MEGIKIMNSKDKKVLFEIFDRQWGIKDKIDYVFLMNEKNKVYIVNKEIDNIDLENIRINSIGLYLGELGPVNDFRLSIEGSQILGEKATKNVVELTDEQALEWMKGNDIEFKGKEEGFVIIKNKKDFIGSGKVKEGRILNFVPKTRRLNVSD